MRRRLLAAVGAAVITCLGATGCVAANAQPSASAVKPKVVVVEASASQIVFARKSTGKNLVFPAGTLYARDAARKETKLSSFVAAQPVLLSGATLIQVVPAEGTFTHPKGGRVVHYRDLASGAEGRATVAPGETVTAVAPAGWVTEETTGQTDQGAVQTLTRQFISGASTDLGQPFADGTGFSVTSGVTGLVAYSTDGADQNGSGTVRYMAWSRPGVWLTLYHSTTSVELTCAEPSSTSVACNDFDGGKGLGLLALDHSKNVWLRSAHPKACQYLDYVTVRSNLVGVAINNDGSCTKGEVYRLGAGKVLATSKRTYFPYSLTAGFGGILTGPTTQASVQLLNGVTEAPKTLVKA